MGKSRGRIGPRVRPGLLLAFFFLLIPAPALVPKPVDAGIEWTDAGGTEGARDYELRDLRDLRIVDWPGLRIVGDDGEPIDRDRLPQQQRGIEWT